MTAKSSTCSNARAESAPALASQTPLAQPDGFVLKPMSALITETYLVESEVSDYDLLTDLLFDGEPDFLSMSPDDNLKLTRAKVRKIVHEEFAATIRGELKATSDDLKANSKTDLQKASDDLISKLKLIGGIISVGLLLVFAVVGFYVYSHVPTLVKSEVQTGLDPIRERVTRLETKGELFERFKQSDSVGQLKEDLPDISAAFRSAKQQDTISIGVEEVKTIGYKLLKVKEENPDLSPLVGDALNAVIAYRSLLNAKLYIVTIRTNNKRTEAFRYTYTPTSIAYSIERVRFEGVTQQLDWVSWKDVVFSNSVIKYDGNPVELNNVAFENCEFVLSTEKGAPKLSKELLTHNPVTVDVVY